MSERCPNCKSPFKHFAYVDCENVLDPWHSQSESRSDAKSPVPEQGDIALPKHVLLVKIDTLRAALAAAEERVKVLQELAETWLDQQTKYPIHDTGRAAAAAVRLCAGELLAALKEGRNS